MCDSLLNVPVYVCVCEKFVYIYMYIYIYAHIYMYICICICTYIYAYMHIYILICIYISIYTYTYKTLQHTCNTLQRAVTQCNTLQHRYRTKDTTYDLLHLVLTKETINRDTRCEINKPGVHMKMCCLISTEISPLHLQCHSISIFNLKLIGLFSTERGK